ncbi:MAG TPA: hypothetical protein VI752_00090 [Candidatus Paceibacterota bacterium]
MRFNIFRKKRPNLLNKPVLLLVGSIFVVAVYIFSNVGVSVSGQEIGYIRDVYRDQQYWVVTFDKIPNGEETSAVGEETAIDNLKKIVLARRFVTEISSLEPSISKVMSPLSLYDLIIKSGADFQNIPFVITLDKGQVVRLEEII